MDALRGFRFHQLRELFRDFARRVHDADVRLPRHAAVKLLVSVYPPFLVHRPNPEGEWARVSVVEADHPRPVPWNVERTDDVRVQPVAVVQRIVHKFRESLPVERVPFAQQQRIPQRLGLLFQFHDVVPRDVRIVHRRCRNVLDLSHAHPAEYAAFNRHLGGSPARVRAVHKSRLHPRMPRTARVACASHAGRDAQPLFCTQSCAQVIIHRFCEMCQLVEIQPVDFRALIFQQPLSLVAQVAEMDDASVAQPQLVRTGNIFAQFLRRNELHRPDQRHFQFGIGSPE